MIVLASASPRRKEIMEKTGYPFLVCPAKGEEKMDLSLGRDKAVERVCLAKAREVFARYPESVTVASDTSVWVDGTPLGKPENDEDAKRMLSLLSGRTHEVVTGVTILSGEKSVYFSEVALVTFAPLTQEEIAWYVSTGEPADKAGAYGIQGLGARFVTRLSGDYYAVMGLPCAALYQHLKEFV